MSWFFWSLSSSNKSQRCRQRRREKCYLREVTFFILLYFLFTLIFLSFTPPPGTATWWRCFLRKFRILHLGYVLSATFYISRIFYLILNTALEALGKYKLPFWNTEMFIYIKLFPSVKSTRYKSLRLFCVQETAFNSSFLPLVNKWRLRAKSYFIVEIKCFHKKKESTNHATELSPISACKQNSFGSGKAWPFW